MSKAWEKGSDTRWRRLRLYVLDRDHHTCTLLLAGCATLADQVDHVIPLSKGGAKYDPTNCRAACARCNTSRGDSAPVAQPSPSPTSSW